MLWKRNTLVPALQKWSKQKKKKSIHFVFSSGFKFYKMPKKNEQLKCPKQQTVKSNQIKKIEDDGRKRNKTFCFENQNQYHVSFNQHHLTKNFLHFRALFLSFTKLTCRNVNRWNCSNYFFYVWFFFSPLFFGAALYLFYRNVCWPLSSVHRHDFFCSHCLDRQKSKIKIMNSLSIEIKNSKNITGTLLNTGNDRFQWKEKGWERERKRKKWRKIWINSIDWTSRHIIRNNNHLEMTGQQTIFRWTFSAALFVAAFLCQN